MLGIPGLEKQFSETENLTQLLVNGPHLQVKVQCESEALRVNAALD